MGIDSAFVQAQRPGRNRVKKIHILTHEASASVEDPECDFSSVREYICLQCLAQI
jgi:hypothetical protein